MRGLFTREKFIAFGATELLPADCVPPTQQVTGSHKSALRLAIRQECPKRAGVYGMLDSQGQLVYVGKSKQLRCRLLSYFRKTSDEKSRRVMGQAKTIIWEPAPSEFAALLRELELIRRFRPRFNVQGQPGRRRWTYLCVGRPPAPYLYLVNRPGKDVTAFYGPIPSSFRTRNALRYLHNWFKLRDCPNDQEMVFADQNELFPIVRTAGCLRYEIGTCLGPCVAGCTRKEYSKQVRSVRTFLEGKDNAPIIDVESEMNVAAAALQFERAASLRDSWESLTWLHRQLERLQATRRDYSFVYPVAGNGGPDLWYWIIRGNIVAVRLAPRTSKARAVALDQFAARLAQQKLGSKVDDTPDVGRADFLLLVSAWFRKHPEELVRTIAPRQ